MGERVENIPGNYKQIKGFSNYYITDSGDVYSNRHNNGYQGIRKLAHKGINNPKRYAQVALCKNGHIKYMQVHTLVATYFCKGYFDGAVVNHIDGNIHNNDYRNLEWVTQKENVHKSYISSGINATRNYNYYVLTDENDNPLSVFKGRNAADKFIESNNINASSSSIKRHGKSRGYKLQLIGNKEAVTTIREEYPWCAIH